MLLKILKIILVFAPYKDVAIINAPKQLKTVDQRYVAEKPTKSPPNGPIKMLNFAGKIV